MENNESFNYSYCAKQQDEIMKIREKYLPKEEDKMEILRRLDKSATKRAATASIILGVVSCLLLGIGMSCAMVWSGSLFFPGIIIGVLGIAGISAAWPLYSIISKRERKRIAPEIIRLTDELMQ